MSDDAIYYTSYMVTPQFTSQANNTGTITAYISTNFAANTSLTLVNGGTGASAPAQGAFSALGVGSGSASTVASNVASGTALKGWIGVEVAHTNSNTLAGIGSSQSATVTYTLTVP